MAKTLVIVESPAKAKTIEKYLGKGYSVIASKGHVRDLPDKRLGVDLKNGFQPEYEILPDRKAVITALRKAADSAERVYLAPDPDREGEAIAWHIAEALELKGKAMRATFNEITRKAVQEAIENPGELNMNLVDAQQARRVLDRLVGYKISPLLGRQLRWGLSAGRVQSVAVKLVVDREREIRAFIPIEYWSITARAHAKNPPPFTMKLSSVRGKKAEISKGEVAHAIVEAVRGKPFLVSELTKKEVRRRPAPPFITSTLQQEAARKLRFPTQRTMQVAQGLYEGIEIGSEGAVGLITYMRTDSVRISDDAARAAHAYIVEKFGKDYAEAGVYRTGKGAQDAHEAIRPTDLSLTPERVAPYLDERQLALYRLIWNRFIASQMASAVLEQTRVDATPDNGTHVFTATGQTIKFPGFLALYVEGRDDEEEAETGADGSENAPGAKAGAAKSRAKAGEDATAAEEPKGEDEVRLPALAVGESLRIEAVTPNQHFTKPPARFSEAALVKELERLGIGRPSTYASIISTIQEKKYVEKTKSYFTPTEMGEIVTDLLVKAFPEIMDTNFTAHMETELDEIEQGRLPWGKVLEEFYESFSKRLKEAGDHIRKAKQETTPTEFTCPTCSKPMVLRTGRNGRFLACTDWPTCATTADVIMEDSGAIKLKGPIAAAAQNLPPCEVCGKDMVLRRSKKGPFLACSGYPDCKNTLDCEVKDDGTVVAIPKMKLVAPVECPECSKPMMLRKGRRGFFVACTGYPECRSTADAELVSEGLYRPVFRAAASGGEAEAGAADGSGLEVTAAMAAKTATGEKKTAARPAGGGAVPAPEGVVCQVCGKPMVVRRGRFGPFFSCSGYPDCKTIQRIPKDMKVDLPALPPKPKPVETDVACEQCGKKMVIRMSKRGPFLGCSGYPKCKNAQPLPDNLKDKAPKG